MLILIKLTFGVKLFCCFLYHEGDLEAIVTVIVSFFMMVLLCTTASNGRHVMQIDEGTQTDMFIPYFLSNVWTLLVSAAVQLVRLVKRVFITLWNSQYQCGCEFLTVSRICHHLSSFKPWALRHVNHHHHQMNWGPLRTRALMETFHSCRGFDSKEGILLNIFC